MKRGIIFLVLLIIPLVLAEDIQNSPRSINIKDTSSRLLEENYYSILESNIVAKVNNDVEYLHRDRLGSNIATTGNDLKRNKNLPFGQEISNDGITYSFTGKELDDNDLYYFVNRYYNPDSGRFLETDSVYSNPSYVYANNNPLLYVDPDGRNELIENPEWIEKNPMVRGIKDDVVGAVRRIEQENPELSNSEVLTRWRSYQLSNKDRTRNNEFVVRYLYVPRIDLEVGGFLHTGMDVLELDVRHFAMNADPRNYRRTLYSLVEAFFELYQVPNNEKSSFDREDYFSNYLGRKFAGGLSEGKSVSAQLDSFLTKLGVEEYPDSLLEVLPKSHRGHWIHKSVNDIYVHPFVEETIFKIPKVKETFFKINYAWEVEVHEGWVNRYKGTKTLPSQNINMN